MLKYIIPASLRYFLGEWRYELNSLRHEIDHSGYMNGLSVVKNDGIMAHSFPSLIHDDLNNMMVGIRSHVSIFSERSLDLLALGVR